MMFFSKRVVKVSFLGGILCLLAACTSNPLGDGAPDPKVTNDPSTWHHIEVSDINVKLKDSGFNICPQEQESERALRINVFGGLWAYIQNGMAVQDVEYFEFNTDLVPNTVKLDCSKKWMSTDLIELKRVDGVLVEGRKVDGVLDDDCVLHVPAKETFDGLKIQIWMLGKRLPTTQWVKGETTIFCK